MTEKHEHVQTRPLGLKEKLQILVFLPLGILVIVFMFANTVYEETFGRNEVVIGVERKWELFPCHSETHRKLQESRGPYTTCSSLDTDQGTFKFIQASKSRLFGTHYELRFWNERPEKIWPQLKQGCHYRIMMRNGLFDDHKLGVNRMPPQNTIVKLIERVEKTEYECDISATSGKPICQIGQVRIDSKGLRPLSRDCDFETFVKNWDHKIPRWQRQ